MSYPCGCIFILWTQSFGLQQRSLWSAWSSWTPRLARYIKVSQKGCRKECSHFKTNPKRIACGTSPLRCIISFSRRHLTRYSIYKMTQEQEKWSNERNGVKHTNVTMTVIFLARKPSKFLTVFIHFHGFFWVHRVTQCGWRHSSKPHK